MKPARILAVLVYLLLLAGLLMLNGNLLALALPLVVYLLAGVFFASPKPHLSATRRISPDRASPGEPVLVEITVKNHGAGLSWLFVEEPLPPGLKILAGESSILVQLPAGSETHLEFQCAGPRGRYSFDEVFAYTSDQFHLFQLRDGFSAPGGLFIIPSVPALRRVSIRPRQTHSYSGTIPARVAGSGIDFFGVRDYQTGDPLRRINWHASARQPEGLFVNEYEQERAGEVGIILDARQRTNVLTSQGSLFEHQVVACAALAQALLRDGNRVGMLIYGRYLDQTLPGYGKIQRERIFQALARAQPGSTLVFDSLDNLPSRLFSSAAQIVLISPLHPQDVRLLLRMRARGNRILVISPDPVAFQARGSTPGKGSRQEQAAQEALQLALRLARLERTLLFEKLSAGGVQVIDWDVGIPFEQALQYRLSHLRPLIHPLTDISPY